jgi:hypothetical protein
VNTLDNLLQTHPEEPALQKFFEEKPERLCGSIYLMGNSVIRKLPIGNDYVSDFVYVNPQSGRTRLFLVEIESSTKAIFNKDDSFTSDFHKALQQIKDWVRFCNNHQQVVRDILEPLRQQNGDQVSSYIARGILIYGRRAELNSVKRRERWESTLSPEDSLEIRTYDGHAQTNSACLDSSIDGGPECVAYQNRSYVAV